MASWRDVRRFALALPGAGETSSHGHAAWVVNDKFFVWERPLRKSDLAALGDRAPTGSILGVRTADLEMKDALLASDRDVFFTTPHFGGYPAVLVRLERISSATLKQVIVEAWVSRAPKRVVSEFLRTRNEHAPRRRR
jgi:hypothetical protein